MKEAEKDQAESSPMSNLLAELENEQAEMQPQEDTEAEEVLENDEDAELEDEEPEEEAEEPKITEKIIAEAKLPKEFIGKPISELSKSYRNLVADYTNKAKELAELKKQSVKPEVEETEGIPDPIDDPKAYAEYIAKQVEKRLQPIEEAKKAQKADMVFKDIQSQLGKDVDLKALLNEWGEYNGLTEQDYVEYANNPERLTKPVIDYFYAKKYKSELAKRKKAENSTEISRQAKKTTTADPSRLVSYNKNNAQNDNDAVKRLLKMLT